MTKQFSEALLILRLRQGHDSAFRQLHTRYSKALLKTINQIVKDSDEAEDLLQDTYIKIWLRFPSYDHQQSALFSWLVYIARNTAIDALRRRRFTCLPLSEEAQAVPISEHGYPSTDYIDVGNAAQQVLKPSQWQVIQLAYWQGYTAQEIADELVLPVGTVKTRLRQSLHQLRPIFGQITDPCI